jgi:hypothetical protein
MSDHAAFNDHFNKMMFIKKLQAREDLFDKFLTGDGILPEGGGLKRGGGLGSGGGLDNSGFHNRRPAVQQEMLSTTKDDDEVEADENINVLKTHHFKEVTKNNKGEGFKEPHSLAKASKDDITNKRITLNGETRALWRNALLDQIYEESEKTMNKFEEKQHDPKNFQGTTSKAVLFDKEGIVSKFKSIAELSKSTGFSKYSILKGFKPKKNGDSFFHEKLGGTLTFVSRKDL